jgi:excisionase family DNA binding protein
MIKNVTKGIPRLLRVPDVAKLTGLPRWKVLALARAGKLPHMRLGEKGIVVVSEIALAEWIEQQHRDSMGCQEDD